MSEKLNLLVESSPQIHHSDNTASIMWSVTLCLLPAGAWGVWSFGSKALFVLAVSVIAAVLSEALMDYVFKKNTLLDGSAFLTGLLIGYNLPPAVPFYIPVTASVFAIMVVKWIFGGLGGNFMNPALAGRMFVFFSWTSQMTKWTMPKILVSPDTISSATPLGILKTGLIDYTGSANGPAQFLVQSGYPHTAIDSSVIHWINNFFGTHLSNGYFDRFIGFIPGSIGEISAFLLLVGTIYLFKKKIITWEIPVSYLATFGLLVWIFGGKRYGLPLFSGDVLFHLFSGGLILGVFYMATDMVTSPLTRKGMSIFGVGAGFLTFLIRFYGSYPEGVALSILLMNISVPLIDKFSKFKRFGVIREGENR